MEGEDGYVIGGLGITGASFEGRVTRAVNEGIELLGLGFKLCVKVLVRSGNTTVG